MTPQQSEMVKSVSLAIYNAEPDSVSQAQAAIEATLREIVEWMMAHPNQYWAEDGAKQIRRFAREHNIDLSPHPQGDE